MHHKASSLKQELVRWSSKNFLSSRKFAYPNYPFTSHRETKGAEAQLLTISSLKKGDRQQTGFHNKRAFKTEAQNPCWYSRNLMIVPFWIPWVLRTGPSWGKTNISRQFAPFKTVFTLGPLNLFTDTDGTQDWHLLDQNRCYFEFQYRNIKSTIVFQEWQLK